MTTRTAEHTQFLADVLTTAVEGGIGYWARITDCKRADDLSWLEITVIEYESAAEDTDTDIFFSYDALDALVNAKDERTAKYIHTVTLDNVASALRKVIDGGYVNKEMTARIFLAYKEKDAGEIDAYDADAVIQVAALGEVVYG